MDTPARPLPRKLPGDGRYRDFVRNSHVFSSALQEVAGERCLRRVTELTLAPSHLRLLQLMADLGEHTAGQAAAFLGVSPAAATKNVDKLVHLGLLRRLPRRGDRRAARLAISERGDELVRSYEEEKARLLRPVLRELGARDAALLSRLLEKAARRLTEAEGGGAGLRLACQAYCSQDCAFRGIQPACPRGESARARTAGRRQHP